MDCSSIVETQCRGPWLVKRTPAADACRLLDRSNKSTPNHVSKATLSGPPRPGAHNSAPGKRRLSTVIASIRRPGWAASCRASTRTTMSGSNSGFINSSSWLSRCQDTGKSWAVPAVSPASASSRDGGRTCPTETS